MKTRYEGNARCFVPTFPLQRAHTDPSRHDGPESPELNSRRPFKDEQSEVKQLQLRLRSRDDLEGLRAQAARLLDTELTNIHAPLEERSTRTENSQRAGLTAQNGIFYPYILLIYSLSNGFKISMWRSPCIATTGAEGSLTFSDLKPVNTLLTWYCMQPRSAASEPAG
jgi:hypothetical protein